MKRLCQVQLVQPHPVNNILSIHIGITGDSFNSSETKLKYILHKVTHLLVNNPYVIVIAIDYSKAFDTVRHSALLAKWLNWTYRIALTTGCLTFSVDIHITQNTMNKLQR